MITSVSNMIYYSNHPIWDHQVCQILKLLDIRIKYGRRVTLNSYNCKTSIDFLLFHLCQRHDKTQCNLKVNWRRTYKVNKQDKSKYSRVPVIHPSTIHHSVLSAIPTSIWKRKWAPQKKSAACRLSVSAL